MTIVKRAIVPGESRNRLGPRKIQKAMIGDSSETANLAYNRLENNLPVSAVRRITMTNEESGATDRIARLIERLGEGDDQACTELINRTADRVVALTRRMFPDYARLGRWEQSEDIGQNALVRLWNALKASPPRTPAEFHRLAALQIRRELIDQIRRYYGPEGLAAHHVSNAEDSPSGSTPPQPYEEAESTLDPARLVLWTEVHDRVAALPDDEREVFDLVWYEGLTQPEAAKLLGISERTLKRRWLSARVALSDLLEGPQRG